MKTFPFFIMFFFIITLFSCGKRAEAEMIVIKGCEGSYLRLNDLHYLICNEEKLDQFENGTIVHASFVKEENCKNDRVYCMMVHGHTVAEGVYTIKCIK